MASRGDAPALAALGCLRPQRETPEHGRKGRGEIDGPDFHPAALLRYFVVNSTNPPIPTTVVARNMAG